MLFYHPLHSLKSLKSWVWLPQHEKELPADSEMRDLLCDQAPRADSRRSGVGRRLSLLALVGLSAGAGTAATVGEEGLHGAASLLGRFSSSFAEQHK